MKKPQIPHIGWTDVLTFLLFVALATGLWYGHAMNSVRNTTVPVLVSYTGVPGTIAFGGDGLPDTVMIEVRDAGARLRTYLHEPQHLTIDLHSYIHSDKGTIHIPSDALRRSLSDNLQGTSRLISIMPEEITCPYYTEKEKSVSVVLDSRLEMAEEFQMVGEPLLTHGRIKVYGDDRSLDTLTTVHTQLLKLSGLSDTTDVRVALVLPKGLRAERDSIGVRIIAERFTEKKFTLPLHVEDVPENYRIRLFPNQVEVTLRVGMSHFAQVGEQDVRAVCVYTPERTDKLDVELRYKNQYITTAWVYPGTVEFLLEQ